MHRPLSALLALAAVGAVTLAGAPAGGAAASQEPWATVNLCGAPGHRGDVGIRAFVGRRGRGHTQWIRVRLQFWDRDARRWRAVRRGGDAGWARIGGGLRGVMGGTTFRVDPPAEGTRLLLRGLVGVQWRRGARVVDHATVRTTSGHRDPQDRELRTSRASCRIVG